MKSMYVRLAINEDGRWSIVRHQIRDRERLWGPVESGRLNEINELSGLECTPEQSADSKRFTVTIQPGNSDTKALKAAILTLRVPPKLGGSHANPWNELKLRQGKSDGIPSTQQTAAARAEAIRIEGEGLAQNPRLIELWAIEAWDGRLPTVSGGGAVPFIDMRALTAS